MKSRKKQHRRLAAFIILVAIVAWVGGCTAGSSFGLSAMIPSKEKGSQIIGEHASGGGNNVDKGGTTTGYVPGDNEEHGNGSNGQSGEQGGNTVKPGNDGSSGHTGEQGNGSKDSQGNSDHENTNPDDKGGTSGSGSKGNEHNGNTAGNEAGKGQEGDKDVEKPVVTPPGTDEKRVALTFDDGPDLKYTTAVLDILKEKGVKATFFVVGTQVEKYPEIMQRIEEEGHAIGNHTQSHKDLSKLGRSGILSQIDQADKALNDALDWTPTLFRAPYGAVSDTLKKVMKEQNRRMVGWTVDTRDWAGTSIADMRDMIRKQTKPNGIILMHSFGGKHIRNTVDMLPDVIDDLRKMGYTMVTVDDIPE
ncbi:polysaccharide deacetylase family protein [Paenibacillus sp. 1011MAR3C5]|uniref:polysaccharide deacetylase family protein n=1 Tax=Paenibacillus sp. 1011MAR3C5 TaxID=1675787 RepID=UPI000E6C5B83|nr:polysaccharide deacetylase family protein [Paenibacillus sp. 1011MAR3C5]RJE88691.1 polysaccharide deacetylase family protein [Paenibacillus sp. 1011MAR3C5]